MTLQMHALQPPVKSCFEEGTYDPPYVASSRKGLDLKHDFVLTFDMNEPHSTPTETRLQHKNINKYPEEICDLSPPTLNRKS